MKKNIKTKLFGLAACVLLSLFAVSCNKDKDEITEEEARVVLANAEVVSNKVSRIFESSATVEEMAQHLDEIKAMENVEDAWQDDSSVRVKIKDGGIISWCFFPKNYSEENEDIRMADIEKTCCYIKAGNSGLCENKTMCIIDAVPYDEGRNLTSQKMQLVSLFKSKGFRTKVVEGQGVTLKFLCDSMPKYGVIVLLAHGNRYSSWDWLDRGLLNYYRGKHWIMTGTIFANNLYEHPDYRGYWNSAEDFLKDWNFGHIEKTESKEIRNGQVVSIYYLSVDEDFLREKMKTNFSNNSVMFAVTCRALYNDYGLWNVFREKNLGCFFGYDNYVHWDIGVYACSSVMQSMLNEGKTASEAYRLVPSDWKFDSYEDDESQLLLCPENCDITLVERPDWVDLGLPSGLLWATRNVGADSPEDYGDYFAWGETSPKSVYKWSTYRYCNGDYYQLTKYCNNSNYGYNGFTDNLTILQPGDDAATANYGGRTPTDEEWQELMDHTTSRWMTINGVNGRCFTGPNGNSLFLPAAGYRWDSSLHDDGSYGRYWSSSLNTVYPCLAWLFNFGSDNQIMFYNDRDSGHAVRAVRQN